MQIVQRGVERKARGSSPSLFLRFFHFLTRFTPQRFAPWRGVRGPTSHHLRVTTLALRQQTRAKESETGLRTITIPTPRASEKALTRLAWCPLYCVYFYFPKAQHRQTLKTDPASHRNPFPFSFPSFLCLCILFPPSATFGSS